MSKLIVVNSNNNVSVNNNVYTYNFVNGGVTIDQDETLAISQTSIPNSIANFSSIYNNLQFGYLSQGQSWVGGSGGAITFSIGVGSGTTRTINITSGFLWIGYVVTIAGVNTATPIIVTNIALSDVGSSTASVTFNQFIYTYSATTGTAIIAGNQMILSVSSGVPLVNSQLNPANFINTSSVNVFNNFTDYITAVVPQSYSVSNTIYLITMSVQLLSTYNVSYYQNATYSNYFNPVNLSTGYYSITDINNALHKTMYQNGHFFYYEPVVNGSSLTGQVPANIIYPLTLSYNFPTYSFNLTSVTSGDNTTLTSTFGTFGGLNQNYITNGSFGDFAMIANPSAYTSYVLIALGNSQNITSQAINGWTAITPSTGSTAEKIFVATSSIYPAGAVSSTIDPLTQGLFFSQ